MWIQHTYSSPVKISIQIQNDEENIYSTSSNYENRNEIMQIYKLSQNKNCMEEIPMHLIDVESNKQTYSMIQKLISVGILK